MIAFLLATAFAGDPCPIDLRFYAYTPAWRDRAADLAELESKREWIGFSHHDRDGRVVVRRVIPGSPADAAGMKKGDAITTIAASPVTDGKGLNAVLDAQKPGAPVAFVVERDGARTSLTVQPGPADPVFLGLVNRAEKAECRSTDIQRVDQPREKALEAGVFDANKGFRCTDAHTSVGEPFQSGDVVMVRGGHRLLFTMPGWRTMCVAVKDLDGAKLTPESLDSVLEELTAPYVRDRHENP